MLAPAQSRCIVGEVVVGGSGTEPARAGNVGTGRAFALEREGRIKGVDVPVLAPAQSRCFVGEVVVGFDK